MPSCSNDRDCLVRLGRALGNKRVNGEQFCVFAFDCKDHEALEPDPAGIARGTLPLSERARNWDGAFYSATRSTLAQIAVLEQYGRWISDYEIFYGKPATLYVYSFLIPCLRDGHHGHCSDNVAEVIYWCRERYGLARVRMGWSNNDRDPELARAIQAMVDDMEEEGMDVAVFPDILVAG